MHESRKPYVMENKGLLIIYRLTWMDTWRNEDIWRRIGVRDKISDRVKVLQWFGHVEGMSGERL